MSKFIFLSLFLLAPFWLILNVVIFKRIRTRHEELHNKHGRPNGIFPKSYKSTFAMSRLITSMALFKQNDKVLSSLGFIATLLQLYVAFALIYIIYEAMVNL